MNKEDGLTDKLYVAFGVKTITVKCLPESKMYIGPIYERDYYEENRDEDFFFMCETKQMLLEKLEKLRGSSLVKEVRIYTVPIFSRFVPVDD